MMWTLLLLLQHANAGELQKNHPMIRQVDTCPDVGYFFKREQGYNLVEPLCFLCFCRDDGTAMCWPRQNRRCDTKYYTHNKRKKRQSRVPRSPGFTDLFFKDIFSKQTPQDCKPFESSFSEGCPPADWCIGCTVCDCDANGRWDCHVLSFCPNDKGKRKMKKKKTSYRSPKAKRQLSTLHPKNNRNVTPINQQTKIQIDKKFKNSNSKAIQMKQNVVKQLKMKQMKINQINAKQLKEKQSVVKRQSQVKKSASPRNEKKNKKTAMDKTYQMVNKKPMIFPPTKDKHEIIIRNNSNTKIAQIIMKKVMKSIEKILNDSQIIYKNCKEKNSQSVPPNGIKNPNKLFMNSTLNKILQKHWEKVIPYDKENNRIKRDIRKASTPTIEKGISSIDIKNMENVISNVTNGTNKIHEYTGNEHFKSLLVPNKLNNTIVKTNDDSLTNFNTINYLKIDDEEKIGYTNISRSRNLNKYRSVKPIRIRKYPLNKKINRKLKTNNRRPQNLAMLKCKSICILKLLKENMHEISLIGFDNERNEINLTKYSELFKFMLSDSNNSTQIHQCSCSVRRVIKEMCNCSGHCTVHNHNKSFMQTENELRVETRKLLKVVLIIKGLLKLLNDSNYNSSKYNANLSDVDYRRLAAVLNKNLSSNVSQTTRIQVFYITKNVKDFIISIKRMAQILKNMASKHKNKYFSRLNTPNAVVKQYETKEQAALKKFNKMKQLFNDYNLHHNNFIKKMHSVLNTLDAQNSKSKDNTTTVRNLTVEANTKDILDSLKKLKNVVLKLTPKGRRRRHITKDDSGIDYLLMLVEFILKQNQPIEVAPVNDGIDLLIEAIKNAPNVTLNKSVDALPLTNETSKFVYEDNEKSSSNETSKEMYSIIESESKVNNDQFSDSFGNITSSETYPYIIKEDYLYKKPNNSKFEDKILGLNEIELIGSNKTSYEILMDETDEEDLTASTTAKESNPSTTACNTEELKVESLNNNNDDKNDQEIAYNSKLNWIDETFDNDLKKMARNVEITTPPTEKFAVTTEKNLNDKYSVQMSSSHESTEDRNTTSSVTKYPNIFSSMDRYYEKSDSESNSKEEKYNPFSQYS